MNGTQFLERWPAKEGRLFLFGGGKDHDRLALFSLVCDSWRKKVGALDFVWLHNPTMVQVSEAARVDPLQSKFRVVAAVEMAWDDPSDADEVGQKRSRQRQFDSLYRLTSTLPRDLVLLMSTHHENPLTKNDLAQSIITKGYWVVLKPVDRGEAVEFLQRLTLWEEDFSLEVVDSIGTSLGDLLAFLRLAKLLSPELEEATVSKLLAGHVRGTVFELVDAIIMKKLELAYSISADELPMGQVVGALDRKLTSLVQFVAEMKRGRSPKEAALALRLPGFIVHGLYEASKRWTGHEILDSFEVLARYSVEGDKVGSLELMVRELIA